MRKLHPTLRSAFLILTLVLLTFSYQNCGGGFTGDASRMVASFSTTYSGSCDSLLMNLYRDTYYPMVTRQCGICHTAGPGIGNFGSSDFETSYKAFQNTTRARVERNATNESHQPPRTGAVNQGIVDAARPKWVQAEAEYSACLAKEGGGTIGDVVLTSSKADSRIIPAGTRWTKLEWNLNSDLADSNLVGKYPLNASIEVRVATISGAQRGYEFRNPLLRMSTATSGVAHVEGLKLFINGAIATDVTTYAFISIDIPGVTDVNLYAGAANAFYASDSVIAADTFALRYDSIKLAAAPAATPTPTPTATPTPTPAATAITYNELIGGGDAAKAVFKNNCVGCHSTNNMSGGFDITSYTKANSNSGLIYSRMTNANKPMPPSGPVSAAELSYVKSWYDGGAPK